MSKKKDKIKVDADFTRLKITMRMPDNITMYWIFKAIIETFTDAEYTINGYKKQ